MTVSTLDVWDRFGTQLRAFIGRRLADPADADDVLQDVFLKLHTRIGSLRDEDRLAPWVYRIARNALTDHYRGRGRVIPLADIALEGPHEDIGSTGVGLPGVGLAASGETGADPDDPESVVARYVAGLVDGLPERYRQAVQLAEIDGLTQQQVAESLGLSLSGAKSRVQRGRAMLRARLLECCHIELDRRGGVIQYRPRVSCCPRCNC